MRIFLLVFLCLLTISLVAEEVVFIKSGKRVLLRDDNTWAYIEEENAETFDFRKTRWGMSMEEVSKSETFEEYGDPSDNILMYSGEVSGLDCVVVYFFTNNLLTGARYFFIEKHTNDNDFMSDYDKMKELLTKKYGTPQDDDSWWKNDLYRDDYSDWGFAISLGHYVKYATWESDRTSIEISLAGENYSITHKIDYSSVELKELKENELTSSALEDL